MANKVTKTVLNLNINETLKVSISKRLFTKKTYKLGKTNET